MRRAALALAWLLAAPAAARPDFASQVVAVATTYQTWDADRPWAKTRPQNRYASAVVVEGSLLLTRAHVVADATLIQVEKRGDALLQPARVIHVDPEIDLALLAVDGPGFFDGLEPARLARSLPTAGVAQSVRWSSRQLEVSSSRVVRIEVRANRYGNVEHAFLLLRTDLENGGWGEPVFQDGRLVGLTGAQENQVASVIPVEVLGAYLAGARGDAAGARGDAAGARGDVPYRGFASFGVVWQNNRDRALARYLGLAGEPRGIVIREARPGSSADVALQPRDILLSLDGHEIDTIGNYEHPRYGRLRFSHLAVDGRAPGDTVRARVWREGGEIEIELPLRRYLSQQRLVPWRLEDTPPPYLVAGGLVFRELDGDYLRTWGSEWSTVAPSELVYRYHLQAHDQTPERRRIILLTHVLPDAYNIGYHDLGNLVVKAVNGRPVGSLGAVAEAFANPEGEFHRVVFHPNGSRRELVLDAASFSEASERILRAYNIPEGERLPPGGS